MTERWKREVAAALGPEWEFCKILGGGHMRWMHTTGAVLIVPSTPSDRRTLLNTVSDGKRAVRETLARRAK